MDSTGVPHGIIVDDRNSLSQTQTTLSQEYHKTLNTGNPTMETSDGSQQPEEGDAQERLRTFWTRQMDEIQNLPNNEFKTQELPLARIKKIMKMDEDVKMISAEAPLLFSKAAQIFITELSLRAWVHTEESKRRTLQRNDIATAITKFDQFDFLIDIVPREELKPLKRTYSSGGTSEVQQYVYAVPQQQQQQTSAPAANANVNVQTQSAMQSSALQSGQLLIAQQSQNGQPLTLTPISMDGAQLLQLSQGSQQIQPPQQAQAVVLNPTTINNDQVIVQPQTQQQQLDAQNTQANEQKQQQQSLQAAIQQLLGNASNAQGEVHSFQMNAQGQLQLVKIINPQAQQQGQSQPGNAGAVRQESASQIFSISSSAEVGGAQGTTNINAMYVNTAE